MFFCAALGAIPEVLHDFFAPRRRPGIQPQIGRLQRPFLVREGPLFGGFWRCGPTAFEEEISDPGWIFGKILLRSGGPLVLSPPGQTEAFVLLSDGVSTG